MELEYGKMREGFVIITFDNTPRQGAAISHVVAQSAAGALVGGVLVPGAVAHHLDALPHLAGTGAGQRAAIHDKRVPGTHDEAGLWNKRKSASYS